MKGGVFVGVLLVLMSSGCIQVGGLEGTRIIGYGEIRPETNEIAYCIKALDYPFDISSGGVECEDDNIYNYLGVDPIMTPDPGVGPAFIPESNETITILYPTTPPEAPLNKPVMPTGL